MVDMLPPGTRVSVVGKNADGTDDIMITGKLLDPAMDYDQPDLGVFYRVAPDNPDFPAMILVPPECVVHHPSPPPAECVPQDTRNFARADLIAAFRTEVANARRNGVSDREMMDDLLSVLKEIGIT